MSVSKLRPQISSPVLFIVLPLTLLLTACGQKYSPDTYSSSAVQQASKVESGVVVGVRKVAIRADPSIATATGAAAGGIAGSQVAEGAVSALSALGGAVVGGIAGSEAGHQVQDTFGFEYIVRNAKGDLLSVTQKDTTPLKIGQRVLLIQGSQARIVNDYTEHVDTDPASSDKQDMSKSADKQGDIKPPAPAAETDTQKMLTAATAAATAAALAAITAESAKDSKDDPTAPAAAAAAAAVTPDAAASAAPEAAPAAEEPAAAAAAPVPDKTDESKTAQSKADGGKEAETPVSNAPTAVSPKPGEQAVPAPASTIVVALPAETAPDASTASPSTAPAGAKSGTPATKAKPKHETADEAEHKDEPASDAESDAGPEDEASEPAADPAPAKPDDSTAH